MKKKYRYLLIPFLGLLSFTLTAQEKTKEPSKQSFENMATVALQELDADVALSEQQRSQLKTVYVEYAAETMRAVKIANPVERIAQCKAVTENYNSIINGMLSTEQVAVRMQKDEQRSQQRGIK